MKEVLYALSGAVFIGLFVVCVLISPRYLDYPAHPRSTNHYACLSFSGRLGNHIYQYASIYGISRVNNLTIILGKDDDLIEYFEVASADIREDSRVCKWFVKKYAPYCCRFDDTFMNLPRNQNYKLGEYLQSWKYFAHVVKEVRKELTFKNKIQQSATYIVDNYRKAYSVRSGTPATVVGVHIRRGDLTVGTGLGGVRLVPDTYITRAVDYFLERFNNIVFIVCSDGIGHAKEVMNYKNISAEFVHLSAVEDLAVLSSCDHVLTTCGTFGWWAGFLSRGTVVYYKYPMVEGTFERNQYNYDEFFPHDWIGLE